MDNRSIDSAQLLERLRVLGITISIDTLQRWAKEGIIPIYTTYYKRRPKKPLGCPPKPGGKKAKEREEKERERGKEKGRPGRYSKWPPEIVVEAAAVWAVRHSGIVKTKTLTNEKISEIKEKAQRVYEYPFAYYELPHDIKLTGPNPKTIYSYDAFTLKVVDDDELNPLVVTWITAQEKAKRGEVLSNPKKVTFHWKSIPKPSDTSGTLWEWMFALGDVVLEDSAQDELVILLDGMDSRKKVMYAPFNDYDPSVKYDPFEKADEFKQRVKEARSTIDNLLLEGRILPVGRKYKTDNRTVTVPLRTFEALLWGSSVLWSAVEFKIDIPYEQVRHHLKLADIEEALLSRPKEFLREPRE